MRPMRLTHIQFRSTLLLPFADGGIDADRPDIYWADMAFEANGWGAFCSKVSPNVNLLGVIKTASSQEADTLARRVFLADRCKWAAGRLLARVPLPKPDQPLTGRQVRDVGATACKHVIGTQLGVMIPVVSYNSIMCVTCPQG